MPSLINQMRNAAIMPQQMQPQMPQQSTQQYQINEEYINQLKTIMHSQNAYQLLNQLAQTNPQMQKMISIIQSSKNPKLLYESLAKQIGADPNLILNKLLS